MEHFELGGEEARNQAEEEARGSVARAPATHVDRRLSESAALFRLSRARHIVAVLSPPPLSRWCAEYIHPPLRIKKVLCLFLIALLLIWQPRAGRVALLNSAV